MNSVWPKTLIGLCVLSCGAVLHAEVAPLPLCCSADFEKLALVPLPGVDVDLKRLSPEQGGPLLTMSFEKTGTERRFIALETVPRKPLTSFKALNFQAAATFPDGIVLRPALMAYEQGNGVWFKTGSTLTASNEIAETRMSLTSFREVAFSHDESNALEWPEIRKLWFGFIVDGRGAGIIKLGPVFLTSEPFRPSNPVSVLNTNPESWSLTADSAVTKKVETQKDGEAECLRLSFTFPGGKHMYFTPSQSLPEMEYSSYTGIRIVYKAETPEGINGLLIQVHENGGGAFLPPSAPPATGKWETVDLPFAQLKLASWTKDANGKLDLGQIGRLSIGAHGSASGEGGDGVILVKSVQIVP